MADIYVPDTDWHEVGGTGEPSFENSWVNYSVAWSTAGFRIDAEGWVHLKGLVKSGTNGATIFTLPEGYRPQTSSVGSEYTFAVGLNYGSATVSYTTYIYIIPSTGEVRAFANAGTPGTWTSLSGVQFPVAPRKKLDRRNITDMSIDAPVVNEVPHAVRRRNGMVVFSGVSDVLDTTAVDPNLGDFSTGYSCMTPVRDNTATTKRMDICRARGILSVTTSPTDFGVFHTEWALPETDYKWITPSYSNSWVDFGIDVANNWEGARYFKDEFGYVHLRGLVKNGSAANATIFTLPSGYRPSHGKHEMFATLANSALCRMDVLSTGQVQAATGGSTTWTSLNGIHFHAGW